MNGRWIRLISPYFSLFTTHALCFSAAFSPLKIRLGGTLQDRVIYDIGHPIEPCEPFSVNQYARFGFSGGCLSIYRWDILNFFFQLTGAEVIFGLNALYGRTYVNGTYGPWNSTNARDLIRYSFDRGYKIKAWEFGNELSGGTSLSAQQYGDDIKELKRIVDETYSGQTFQPLVVTPDGYFDPNWYRTLLEISGPSTLNVITEHMYILGPASATNLVEEILNPAYLDTAIPIFEIIKAALTQYGPWASLWIGESGGAYNSGQHLVTDAFVSGFWYVDQLGMAATFDTKTYCRQTLVGGYYGLLNFTTFHPNPDYYSALLWHRLMGGRVLATGTPDSPYLRHYAHCSKKDAGITLVFLNLSNGTHYSISVSIDLATWSNASGNDSASTRQEFHFTAMNGDLQSQTVLLNGNPLYVTWDGKIPDMPPSIVNTSLPIDVAPLSIAFISLPNQIPACS